MFMGRPSLRMAPNDPHPSRHSPPPVIFTARVVPMRPRAYGRRDDVPLLGSGYKKTVALSWDPSLLLLSLSSPWDHSAWEKEAATL